MGQTQFQSLPSHLAVVTGKLARNASEIRQTAALTYEQFLESITTLNDLAYEFSDISGKHLIFCIRKGTDTTIWWKGTVQIKCHKVISQTGVIEATHVLSLKQFIVLYNEMMRQHQRNHFPPTTEEADDRSQGASNFLDASVLLSGIKEKVDIHDEECVICMDRKAEVILPCSHTYCEKCIDEWQGNHKNCPICRAAVKGREDTWVLSEKPRDDEIAHASSGYLMGLVDRHPLAHPDSDSD